jgi:PiT family inorganic phosphate transporter
MPVSTTHSIVGAVAGFGIVAVGWSAVEWHKLGQIAASWFLSPLVGGLLGFLLFRVISKLVLGRKRPVPRAIIVAPFIVFLVTVVITLSITYKGLKHVSSVADWLTGPRAIVLAMLLGLVAGGISRLLVQRALKGKEGLPLSDQLALVEGVFAPLVVISSCSVAFSHGANDVANAVGPLAAIVDIVASGTVKMKVAVPMWVLILGGVGIVIGLATYGYRVMHTIGTKITEMTPSRGVAANVAAATTVLVCTRMGLPVSTTHTLVGAVLGIGLARGLTGINRQVTRDIFTAWIITVPAAALLTVVFFLIGKALFFESILRAMQ